MKLSMTKTVAEFHATVQEHLQPAPRYRLATTCLESELLLKGQLENPEFMIIRRTP
jgi:hypothetical protein